MEIESQITDSNAANWIVAEALFCVPFFEGDPAKISTLEPPTWLEGEMAWDTLQVSTYIHWQGVDFTIDGVHRTPHMPDTILDYNHSIQVDSHWNQEWQRTEMVDESADEVLNAWPFFLDDSRNENLRIAAGSWLLGITLASYVEGYKNVASEEINSAIKANWDQFCRWAKYEG